MLLIQVLRSASCGQIVAVDLDESRLELARQLGADHAFNPETQEVVGEVLALTARRGAGIAFEAVGVTRTVKTAIQCLRKGGTLVLVGNLAPTVEVPLQDVVTRELSLKGTYCSVGEYPACLEMISRGVVDVAPMISAVAPLAEGAAWFDRLRSREPGLVKVVLLP